MRRAHGVEFEILCRWSTLCTPEAAICGFFSPFPHEKEKKLSWISVLRRESHALELSISIRGRSILVALNIRALRRFIALKYIEWNDKSEKGRANGQNQKYTQEKNSNSFVPRSTIPNSPIGRMKRSCSPRPYANLRTKVNTSKSQKAQKSSQSRS